MKFLLLQLNNMNYSKPLVQVSDKDEWVQWDTCDLEGLPVDRIGITMNSHGKIPKGQWDNLPELFTSIHNDIYKIEDIHSLKSS